MSTAKPQLAETALEQVARAGNLPDFELGVTRFFGRGDLSDKYFDRGWAAPEENHSWNDGIDASIIISMKPCPAQTCALKIRGVPYLADNIRSQDITLYVNGHRAAFWRVHERQTQMLVAAIEPEFWVIRNGKGIGKFVWHIPGSAKPSDSSGINDRRQLGFCFLDITVDVWPA